MEQQAWPSAKDQENLKRSSSRRLRFGSFEVDLAQHELRREGVRVSLQQKPFQVLALLLEHPGELVSRAQLAKHLWPDLHVDFDRSLNTAVNALRQALNDSPQQSRFIETRSGLGYRFVAEVEVLAEREVAAQRRSVEQIAESVMAAVAGALNLPRNVLDKRGAKSAAISFAEREANGDCRRGRYLLERYNQQDVLRSEACFEAALARAPRLAAAYSGLADVQGMSAFLGVADPREAYPRARQLAERALEVDESSADAHCAMGHVKSLFAWDWAGAETEFRLALELDNGHARTHQLYADLLAVTGRIPEALTESARAQELEPVFCAANLEAAWICYLTDDYDRAAAHAWSVLTVEPRLAHAQYLLGLAYEQANRLDDAMTEFENSYPCFGCSPAIASAMGHALVLMGEHARAREKFVELDRTANRHFAPVFWRAILHVAFEEREEALQALELSFAQREVWLPWLGLDPRLRPLRGNARFESLLKRVRAGG